jgi:hypothetical protein
VFLNMAGLRRPATDTGSSWPEWVVHECRNRKLVFAVRLNIMPRDVEMRVNIFFSLPLLSPLSFHISSQPPTLTSLLLQYTTHGACPISENDKNDPSYYFWSFNKQPRYSLPTPHSVTCWNNIFFAQHSSSHHPFYAHKINKLN